LECINTTNCTDISAQTIFSIDTAHRIVTVKLNGELQRPATYRLRISKNLAEVGATPRKLAQTATNTTLPDDVYLSFSTRTPQGSVGTTTLENGQIRDLALDGNLLLVAALGGGLQAFDVANAASNSNTPVATAPAPAGGEVW